MKCKEAQQEFNARVTKQFVEMKRKHPDALLLFRVGDTYETYYEDADFLHEVTKCKKTRSWVDAKTPVPVAWFEHSALDTFLPKLVRAGRRVAICEQLEDPRQAKKIVKRGGN